METRNILNTSINADERLNEPTGCSIILPWDFQFVSDILLKGRRIKCQKIQYIVVKRRKIIYNFLTIINYKHKNNL
ncbi:hypothetical protein DUD79_10030 [Priestia aryabhattai]|jgi:hypothetical protein